MLYDLGKALNKDKLGDRRPQSISDAAGKLIRLLAGDDSVQPAEQLDGKQLSLSAWALSQLKACCEPNEAKRFGLSLAAQMLSNTAVEDWRSLSGLLYGLAKSGIGCESSRERQLLFTVAVSQRLPELSINGDKCSAQDVSITLLACLEAGYDGDMQPLMSGIASPARVSVLNADDAKAQAVSNVAWAHNRMRCYDAAVYSTASEALLLKFDKCNGQNVANYFIACAEVCHWDGSMDNLAELVSMQSKQQWSTWNGQVISNSLYAWAVLTAAGHSDATASISFRSMAQVLFKQASKRGSLAFNFQDLGQSFFAHQVAVRNELGGGLSANEKLLEHASVSHEASLSRTQGMLKYTNVTQQVAKALERAGYGAKMAQVVEKDGVEEVAPLLARGVAVYIMAADAYFRCPSDLLSGSKRVHVVIAGWVCDGVVVLFEAEWAGLRGDPKQQEAFLAQRMQQALKI